MSVNVVPTDNARCLLDQSRLKAIEVLVTAIDSKLDELLSHEGPVSKIRERLAVVEGATTRSYDRLDRLEHVFETHDSTMTALAVKVAGISAVLTSGAVLAIIKVFG